MINANKEITSNNLNDISMSHFSKPYLKNNQCFSAGLKKKMPSLHQNHSCKDNENEKNEQNDGNLLLTFKILLYILYFLKKRHDK